MFYSHQLLSKKGPLSQIWIAATMHAKINRKKAEQIDIGDICLQIMNPVVPLALRLSSILMGGIVRIYDRKVQFFYDDVTEFLIKIKTLNTVKRANYSTVLPPGRSRARYDAVTIDYSFNDIYDEIEQAMLQPNTPEKAGDEAEEFFIIPEPQKFQACNIDILLEDNITADYHGRHLDDFQRHDEEDRILPPIFYRMAEDNVPDADNLQFPPEMPDNGFEDQPKQITPEKHDEERQDKDAPKSPEPERPPQRRKPARKKKTVRSTLYDAESTEIPGHIFRSWLNDTSSISHRRQRRRMNLGMPSAKGSTLLKSPSTFLSVDSEFKHQSIWPSALLQLWNATLVRGSKMGPCLGKRKSRQPLQTDNEFEEQRKEAGPAEDGEDLNIEYRRKRALDPHEGLGILEDHGVFNNKRKGELSDQQEEINLQQEDDLFPAGETARYGNEKSHIHGSIEKLRSALRTPNPLSEEEFLGNQYGATPIFASSQSLGKRRKISLPDRLLPDIELELPTSGRSKGSRFAERRRSVSPALFEVYGKDQLPDVMTPKLSVEMLVETGPSQGNPQDNIDRVTASMLKCLREHFNAPGAARQHSLNELSGELNRPQASKLFFQICVLASNRFLSVHQNEPYGDIIMSRGDYL